MLVVTAGNQNHLLMEGAQTGDGAGGAGGDGVVVVAHPVPRPHQLNAVLYPRKFGGEVPHHLVGHQPVQSADGRHVILDVVLAGQEDVFQVEHRALVHGVAHPDGPVSDEDALLQLLPAAEPGHAAAGTDRKAAGNLVILVQHQQAVRSLVGEDVLLGGDVLLHRFVYVQVVRGQIGDHRDIRALLHGHQLKRRQFQHGHVLWHHPVHVGQQRFADVASHIDALPRRFQQLGNDRSGGGLSVAASHRDGFAGADLEKNLHLRGDGTPPFPGRQQLGHVRTQAGGTEDHIVVQPVQIVRAQAQLGPQTLQLLRLAAEVLPLPLVAGGYLNIRPQQHFDERCVGHADAQHRHPFAPQGRQILLYGGTHGSFLPFFFVYN